MYTDLTYSCATGAMKRFIEGAIHQSPKANGSRLAFFIPGRREDVGVREGGCGLRGSALLAPVSLSPGGSSLLVGWAPMGEVRKRPDLCAYKSGCYAWMPRVESSLAAVSWRHPLRGRAGGVSPPSLYNGPGGEHIGRCTRWGPRSRTLSEGAFCVFHLQIRLGDAS